MTTKVEGTRPLFAKLTQLGAARQDVSLEVGYRADYSLWVHENMMAFHPHGQAKYLEQPMRLLAGDLGKMVTEDVKRGLPLRDALLAAGEILLEESKRLVPVRTGALRDSGYVEVK